jgi:hypothetical protein
MPPSAVKTTASVRNCTTMSLERAPSAFRTPISRVRSVTLTNMMFMTPMPPTSNPIELRITITSATVLVMRRKSSIICSAEAKTGYRLDRLPVPATELTQALGRQTNRSRKASRSRFKTPRLRFFRPVGPRPSPRIRFRPLETARSRLAERRGREAAVRSDREAPAVEPAFGRARPPSPAAAGESPFAAPFAPNRVK